ncbi:hypothetical protein [Aminiphilus sp.]|uniref:hypothetical protein n=1 Tax=Aminiphilus sp. TaxID=1872488 RepID=UPI002625E09B|nr:hypothetical protein [Aminiphilus sp.]
MHKDNDQKHNTINANTANATPRKRRSGLRPRGEPREQRQEAPRVTDDSPAAERMRRHAAQLAADNEARAAQLSAQRQLPQQFPGARATGRAAGQEITAAHAIAAMRHLDFGDPLPGNVPDAVTAAVREMTRYAQQGQFRWRDRAGTISGRDALGLLVWAAMCPHIALILAILSLYTIFSRAQARARDEAEIAERVWADTYAAARATLARAAAYEIAERDDDGWGLVSRDLDDDDPARRWCTAPEIWVTSGYPTPEAADAAGVRMRASIPRYESFLDDLMDRDLRRAQEEEERGRA